MAVLSRLERKYGRLVLTDGCHHISRVSSLCGAFAEEDPKLLFELVLLYLDWALKVEFVSPSALTTEALANNREGALGYTHAAAGRFSIIRCLHAWANGLEEAAKGSDAATLVAELVAVISCLDNYAVFAKTFDATTAASAASQWAEAQAEGQEFEQDAVAKIKATYTNKVSRDIIGFCYNVFSCVHDEAIEKQMGRGRTVSRIAHGWTSRSSRLCVMYIVS